MTRLVNWLVKCPLKDDHHCEYLLDDYCIGCTLYIASTEEERKKVKEAIDGRSSTPIHNR